MLPQPYSILLCSVVCSSESDSVSECDCVPRKEEAGHLLAGFIGNFYLRVRELISCARSIKHVTPFTILRSILHVPLLVIGGGAKVEPNNLFTPFKPRNKPPYHVIHYFCEDNQAQESFV